MTPMDEQHLTKLLDSLRSLPRETEWVEFKHNRAEAKEIGDYLSALSNAAGLHLQPSGYIVWGIEDGTHRVVGTTFRPREEKVGNEDLEAWLARLLEPRIDFCIHEFQFQGNKPIVIIEVQSCRDTPVQFMGTEWIRVGSYKKKLKDYKEKERSLWLQMSRLQFEEDVAISALSDDDVLRVIDYPGYFDLVKRRLPTDKNAILDQLCNEQIIVRKSPRSFDITNLGALLFAKRLSDFKRLGRKAVRVIEYGGVDRIHRQQEHVDDRGYAVGFVALLAYINDRLPHGEMIGQALRSQFRLYPELAIRELLANAIIHQDLTVSGESPMVEIFSDRVEFTNPGEPLVDLLRFLDAPPQSRNEAIAAMMRRVGICEEGGSGIDKVVYEIERNRLPAPDFTKPPGHTKAVLYERREVSEMTSKDRVRACYLHACLEWVSNRTMTNASLRLRFGIADQNYAVASRIIADTLRANLIRLFDPASKSKKHARYIPFWG